MNTVLLDHYTTPGGGRVELIFQQGREICNVYSNTGEHRIRQRYQARYWFMRVMELCRQDVLQP